MLVKTNSLGSSWLLLVKVVVVLLLLSRTVAEIYAQDKTTLAVDKATGTISSTNPCPVPRNSAVYATIQAAIGCAQNGDILTIFASTYLESIVVDKNVTLSGVTASTTIISSGINGHVVAVANGVSVILNNLTITGGSAEFGGGIYTNTGNIEIIDSVITGNKATTAGGGIYSRAGTIILTNSTVSNNQPAGDGGGIFTRAGTVIIKNSTISGHLVNGSGGGVESIAGTVTMTNSTVSGNSANAGGGIKTDAGTVTMGNVTVADNNSGVVSTQATVKVGNSILASNNGIPCIGTLVSTGHNVTAVLSGNCTFSGDSSGNITGVDPKLGVLKANGGTTQTQAVLDGSPAIDVGSGCESTDQRGAARPQGAGCDAGAYEGIRGDCNADLIVNSADVSAVTSEIFDKDGNIPTNVPAGTFAGDSIGCNSNADLVVDAGDLACLSLIINDVAAVCEKKTP